MKTTDNARSPSTVIGTIYLWAGGIVITIVMLIIVLPFIVMHKAEAIHKKAIVWGKSLVRLLGINITVHGTENLHTESPVIVIVNHQGFADIPILYSALDQLQFRWMAKSSLFKIPLFGLAMRSAGYIPVERTDRKKSLDSLFKAAEEIRSGKSVIIFPEGTRSHADGSMLSFKKGAFILAKKAAVIIQPITIWGSHRIIPPKQNRKIQRIYKQHVDVTIHEPIMPDEYKDKKPEQLSEMLYEVISKTVEEYQRSEVQNKKRAQIA